MFNDTFVSFLWNKVSEHFSLTTHTVNDISKPLQPWLLIAVHIADRLL